MYNFCFENIGIIVIQSSCSCHDDFSLDSNMIFPNLQANMLKFVRDLAITISVLAYSS